MENLINKKLNNFIIIFFIFIIIPIIMHIYGSIFEIIIQGHFYIFLFISIVFFLSLKRIHQYSIDEKLFVLFLIILAIDTIIFNFNNLKDLIKYILYFIFYKYVIKPYINKKIYYKIFIRIVSILIFIDLYLYFIIPYFPEISIFFERSNLSFLHETSSFLTRTDWNYSLPFYIYSYPLNIPENGILPFPRFYGFSTEPTLLSCILLPSIYIAYREKMYIDFLVLLFAFLLSSSYGAFIVLLISILYYIFFKYKKILTLILVILTLFLILELSKLDSPRALLYSKLFSNVLNISSFYLFSSGSSLHLMLPLAIFNYYLKMGFLPILTYLFFLIYFLKKSIEINKYIFAFTIATILMLNKSGEIISPLLLFLLNYINIYKNNRFFYILKEKDL